MKRTYMEAYLLNNADMFSEPSYKDKTKYRKKHKPKLRVCYNNTTLLTIQWGEIF